MKNRTFVNVAVTLPMHQTFTYSVPEPLVPLAVPGKRVLVPFGPRRLTGYILGPGQEDDAPVIRALLDIPDDIPLFPPEMIPFFHWIAAYYMYPLGQVIQCALPGGLSLQDFSTFTRTGKGEKALDDDSLNPLEREVLIAMGADTWRVRDLVRHLEKEIPLALIRKMTRQEWVLHERRLSDAGTRPRMERYVRLLQEPAPDEKISEPRQRILDALQEQGEMSVRELKTQASTAPALIRSLSEKGIVEIFEKNVYRDPFGEAISPDSPRELTSEQAQVVETVLENLDKGFSAWLLAGVTGSGKTEVYMQLAAEVIRRGLPVVVLVPEIALISQMERRFRARFGEQVAVLHSGLSAGERYDQWIRILSGDAPIVIGARSAVFAPFEKVGLMIVDEEHDTSYKQGSDLLYNAADLAVVRARQSGGVVLLGSATPSVQSFYNVKSKKFNELRLTRRVERRPMPRIRMVDLRAFKDVRGARRFITPPLHQAMQKALENKEQVLLFLNRRGFASFPVCAACGEAIRCRHCDITLTWHKLADVYTCHYCGFTRPASSQCPSCDSPRIKHLGAGTERLEGAVRALFPDATVARMDRDTTTRKGSVLKILKGLQSRAIDILIGTQMVAKGHDFPGITVVGVICADLSLSFPDFRAGERTFQLLAQVAGRAGRGDVPGQVILQTYTPDHFSILAAKNQDFQTFYNTEIGFRRALNYPPYSRIIQLRISGADAVRTREGAETLGRICREIQARESGEYKTVEVMGPIEASIARIADQHRWQILLKGTKVAALHRFVHQVKSEAPEVFNSGPVRIIIDVDPFFMA